MGTTQDMADALLLAIESSSEHPDSEMATGVAQGLAIAYAILHNGLPRTGHIDPNELVADGLMLLARHIREGRFQSLNTGSATRFVEINLN